MKRKWERHFLLRCHAYYKFRILELTGTPYEMGFAHGTLLKKEATTFMNQVWEYLEDQVVRNSTQKRVLHIIRKHLILLTLHNMI